MGMNITCSPILKPKNFVRNEECYLSAHSIADLGIEQTGTSAGCDPGDTKEVTVHTIFLLFVWKIWFFCYQIHPSKALERRSRVRSCEPDNNNTFFQPLLNRIPFTLKHFCFGFEIFTRSSRVSSQILSSNSALVPSSFI